MRPPSIDPKQALHALQVCAMIVSWLLGCPALRVQADLIVSTQDNAITGSQQVVQRRDLIASSYLNFRVVDFRSAVSSTLAASSASSASTASGTSSALRLSKRDLITSDFGQPGLPVLPGVPIVTTVPNNPLPVTVIPPSPVLPSPTTSPQPATPAAAVPEPAAFWMLAAAGAIGCASFRRTLVAKPRAKPAAEAG